MTYILGDSLVKDVKGWKIQEKLVNKQQVVKSFSGAKTECMSEYIKPTLKRNSDRIILHTGTNDLSTDSTDKELATSIINMVTDISASCPSISVSGIVPRADQYAKKARDVNKILKRMRSERNICYISHENINNTHLNGSKIHLAKLGTKLMTKSFAKFIDKCRYRMKKTLNRFLKIL